MCPVLALWPSRTESTQVERTYPLLLVMFERAMWAERTKATVVMWTRGSFGFRINVKVQAVIAVRTRLRSRIV